MKILIPVLFALLGYLGLLRATEKVFNWQKKPARIHALALVVWFVLFGLVQAVLSGLLPVGGVNQFEIVFIILVVTLLNFSCAQTTVSRDEDLNGDSCGTPKPSLLLAWLTSLQDDYFYSPVGSARRDGG